MKLICSIFFLFYSQFVFAQAEPLNTTALPNAKEVSVDSLKVFDEYADEKNGLRSLVVPGWGQVVNKDYIKAGSLAALFGTGLYFTIDKTKEFNSYNDAYTSRLLNFDQPIDQYQDLSLFKLSEVRREKRSNKDIATAATTYIYLMGAVDAAAQYKIARDGDDKHSATKAAYYSALLPGLGQAYNKKYWKIPIVYAALGTAGYFAIDNRNHFRNYRREIEFRSVGEFSGYRSALPEDRLKVALETWRQNRDIAYVAAGAVYMLNILDATVDAHLYNFNVDEDLSFITPSPIINQVNGELYYGVNLSFDLAKLDKD